MADRDHHLAVVLGLALVAALEGDPGQLRDAVDQLGDLGAEPLVDLLEAGAGVLNRVVQQRCAQRLGVEPHPGADLRHPDRVGDELVARFAHLVGVPIAGEDEGVLNRIAVDRHKRLVLMLADHRKQITEQAALLGGEATGQVVDRGRRNGLRGGTHLGVTVPVCRCGRAVRGSQLGGWLRGRLAVGATLLRRACLARGLGAIGRLLGRARRRGLLALGGGVALHGCLRLARYLLPSSRRAL